MTSSGWSVGLATRERATALIALTARDLKSEGERNHVDGGSERRPSKEKVSRSFRTGQAGLGLERYTKCCEMARLGVAFHELAHAFSGSNAPVLENFVVVCGHRCPWQRSSLSRVRGAGGTKCLLGTQAPSAGTVSVEWLHDRALFDSDVAACAFSLNLHAAVLNRSECAFRQRCVVLRYGTLNWLLFAWPEDQLDGDEILRLVRARERSRRGVRVGSYWEACGPQASPLPFSTGARKGCPHSKSNVYALHTSTAFTLGIAAQRERLLLWRSGGSIGGDEDRTKDRRYSEGGTLRHA
eukprot:4820341-Pleurochrysis_carterae.AAC.3